MTTFSAEASSGRGAAGRGCVVFAVVMVRSLGASRGAPAARPSRLFRSIPQFITNTGITIARAYTTYNPLRVFVALGGLCALLGLLPILRFMWFWIDGHGEGHVQSLIIGGALLVLGVLVAVMGLLADLVAANRKLIEAGLVRLRQIEDGLAVMQTEDVGKRRRPTQKEAA